MNVIAGGFRGRIRKRERMMNTKNETYRELLLGCGNSRVKRLDTVGSYSEWQNLTTLDIDPACEPDIVFDLGSLGCIPLPLRTFKRMKNYEDSLMAIAETARYNDAVMIYNKSAADDANSYFDEVHAYEVLEHCGAQGDYPLFFAQFREFWRILKPGGYFCATVPDWRSVWAWGDPSHTRIINEGTLVFLSQVQYKTQVGKTAMSDFRSLLTPADFEIVGARTSGEQFEFVLRAIK